MGLGQSSEQQDDRHPETAIAINMDTKVSQEKKIQGLSRLVTVNNARRKQVYKDSFDHHKDSMGLLKHIFKKMDPAVTKTTTLRPHGDLEMSFKHDPVNNVLLVKIIRARNLDAKDLRGKSADAYVKIALLPNAGEKDVKKTKIIKRTLNPEFHEIFAFDLKQLNAGTVACQVWDHDLLSKDELIGEVLVPLDTLDLANQNMYTGWYTIKSETDRELTGQLEVSLTYKLPNILMVNVHAATNLTNRYAEGAPNPFVKLQIPGIQKVYETEIQPGTANPEWNQTFEFKVPPEDFKFRYVILHCIDYDDADKNESLGQVLIELSNFNPESGYRGKFELADLKNSSRVRTQCFQSTMIQEFQEALVAHACARYPQFLFTRQHGSKMIRVRNNKARSEAKLRIIDGVPMY